MISSSRQHDVLTLQKHACNWLSHNQLVSEWMDLTGWKVEWTNKWNKEGVDGWMDEMISSSRQHDVLTSQKHNCLSHNQLISEWMD